nr:transposase [Solimonas marina]
MGGCALRHPEVAGFVQRSFLHFHCERYHLHAWCVMPNHVHVLLEPLIDLASIVQGWKSFTARWISRNRAALGLDIPEGGPVWMREYWDRYIRDEKHYGSVVDYIHQNPVRAGLCRSPEEWPWSSAGNAGVPAGMDFRADEDVGAHRGADEC